MYAVQVWRELLEGNSICCVFAWVLVEAMGSCSDGSDMFRPVAKGTTWGQLSASKKREVVGLLSTFEARSDGKKRPLRYLV